MRLYDYIKLSSSEDDIAIFRSLSIKLVIENKEYDDIIKRLSEKYKYINESFAIINSINRHLRGVYKGDYRFGFCIDEGSGTDILEIKKGKKLMLSMRCHETNDNFCKIKKILEGDIKK